MHALYASSDYGQLLEQAAGFVAAQAVQQEVVIIASSRAAADNFVRERCGNVAGVHRFTLSQLTALVTAETVAARGYAPLNALGVEAMAARAVHQLSTEGGLLYFQPVAASPGFPRATARTLRELRLQDIPLSNVAKTGEPGYDIASIARSFEDLLAESRLADFPALLRMGVTEFPKHRLAGLPVLLLDIPVNAALVVALLGAVIERAPACCAVALAGDEPTIANLRDLLGVEPCVLEDNGSGQLSALRRNVFVNAATPPSLEDESLDLFSAAGEGLEATEIARRIQAAAGEGVRLDQIAILLRAPERYQPLLEEALHRAEIPFSFTRGSVRPDPAGRAFLALLACASERFTATRFAEYLSLGQTPLADALKTMAAGAGGVFGTEDDLLSREESVREAVEEETATAAAPATPAAWERLIVDAAVVGGRERWERRLHGLENEFQLRLQQLNTEDHQHEHLENQIRLLRNLQALALPVIEQLDALPKSASWREWLEQFTELAQQTLRHPDSVLLALNELWPMGEVGPVTLDEVTVVLADRLRFLRRPANKRRYGQVWIGSIDEARGESFQIVFLPGLAEGVFPKKAFEDPLLLDDTRRLLGSALPLRDDRAAEERLRLRIAAACAGQRLIVSYPRMDVAQNRPRVPSFYAMEVIRAAEGTLPEIKLLERRAARGSLTRLGWPAPADAALSIDALEYDLAMLQQALNLPRGAAKGKGRFLMNLNPHLARSLRARYRRWDREWSASDGLSDHSERTVEILDRHRLHQRSWSASSLQQFTACPYRFLLHGIFQLRPREESVALEQLDPLTRGSLFHEVVYELFQQTQKWQEFEAIADDVFDRVAAKYEDRLAPAILRVWRGETEDLRADLKGWLRRLATDAAGWEAIHSEYAFGLAHDEGRDPHSTAWPAKILDGYSLRGSVDWIERHVQSGALRITDFKTGRSPKEYPAHVGGGAYLQPLLYALAVEYHLKQEVKFSRLYYCTQRGNYEVVPMTPSERAKVDVRHALAIIDEAIEKGSLLAAPAAKQCEYCDYRVVCGPREEERTRRKAAVPGLVALRSLP